MSEEERQLREENTELKAEMQAGFEQKDRRIAELEGMLMAALLRIEELERCLGKDSHKRNER